MVVWYGNVRIFILCSYEFKRTKQIGFICDIHRICTKYDLAHYIATYKHSGQFPSTIAWKRILNRNINEYNHNSWLAQTEQDEFKRFRTVHPSVTKPSVLWLMFGGRGCLIWLCVDIQYGIITEERVIREIRIDEAAGRGDSDSRMTCFEVIMPLKLQSTKLSIYSIWDQIKSVLHYTISIHTNNTKWWKW